MPIHDTCEMHCQYRNAFLHRVGHLSRKLVPEMVPDWTARKEKQRYPTPEERRGRRILLALSWLSFESEKGTPTNHFIMHDLDKQSGKRSDWKTVEALTEFLKGLGLGEDEIKAGFKITHPS